MLSKDRATYYFAYSCEGKRYPEDSSIISLFPLQEFYCICNQPMQFVEEGFLEKSPQFTFLNNYLNKNELVFLNGQIFPAIAPMSISPECKRSAKHTLVDYQRYLTSIIIKSLWPFIEEHEYITLNVRQEEIAYFSHDY